MIVMYVVLDGFDIGAGILHIFIAKNDDERRTILNAIGPFWDGNEVWIIAAGGVMLFAFPKFYASSFSGFYLPLMIVLWLLIGRALGIELRKHVDNPLWKSFWDAVFSISSLLLVILFGAALGNLIRGVSVRQDGYFFEPLWTSFTISQETGILDWFTLLMSLVALITITVHGANYIAMKTNGLIQERARSISTKLNVPVIFLSIFAFVSMIHIRMKAVEYYSDISNFFAYPWGFLFLIIGLMGIAGIIYFRHKQNDTKAFLSSSLFISGALSATAFDLYPNLLISSISARFNITIHNSKTGEYAMHIATFWWIFGILLTIGYFVFLYNRFRGKTGPESEGY